MVLLRCINCSRHLLIHTFIRTVAGHNHYSIYVIKKKREKKPYIPWLRWNLCKEPFDLDLWYFSCVATDGVYFVSLLPFDGDTDFFLLQFLISGRKFMFISSSISSSLWLDSSFSLVLWFALQTNVDGCFDATVQIMRNVFAWVYLSL